MRNIVFKAFKCCVGVTQIEIKVFPSCFGFALALDSVLIINRVHEARCQFYQSFHSQWVTP
eukprot:COSAG05_NODE_55_length_23493_cov_709.337907_9_plen_61_part_00